MRRRVLAMAMAGVMGVACAAARGLETDQYSVPAEPLGDMGPELDLRVDLALRIAANEANEANDAGVRGETAADRDRANDWFAKRVGDEFASGLPECMIESWVRRADFRARPARFDVSIGASCYGHAIFGRPITMIDLAPTINLYGHYVGTDKVGHFFQQGYEYYEVYRDAIKHNQDDAAAVRAAVKKGVSQESGIYGMGIIEVYSNADLASNLAGMMFYRNLTKALTLGERTLPPMLVYHGGRWVLNAAAGDRRLEPLVTDHWDEAMNPSLFGGMLRGVVESNVRGEIGQRWVAFHHTTREREVRRLEELKRWYGIPYGHATGKGMVTIVSAYFDGPGTKTAGVGAALASGETRPASGAAK